MPRREARNGAGGGNRTAGHGTEPEGGNRAAGYGTEPRETWDGGAWNGAGIGVERSRGRHGTGRRGRLLEFMAFMTNITEEK